MVNNNTKRQSCACDTCRRSKKKCDGVSPCGRCKERNKVCTYSHTKRRAIEKKVVSAPVAIVDKTGSNITNQTISRQYLDVYFHKMNPAHLISDFDITLYDIPSSKGVLLQYNAALATASRSIGGSRLYQSFQNRAKQLAAGLMLDFSFDTAFGFYLLSFHLWGEDDELSIHYRNITRSFCKQLFSQAKRKGEPIEHILRLQLALSTISKLTGDTEDVAIAEQLAEMHQTHFKTNNRDATLFGTFRCKVLGQLLKEKNDSTFHLDPFKTISPTEHSKLCKMLERFELLANASFSSPDHFAMISGMINCYKSLLFYTSGNKGTAVSFARCAIDVFSSNSHLTPFMNPLFITLTHLIFMVAFLEQEYLLANRISGFQRKLTQKLPSGRDFLEMDMELLKSVAIERADSSEEEKSPSRLASPPTPFLSRLQDCKIIEKSISSGSKGYVLPAALQDNELYDLIENLNQSECLQEPTKFRCFEPQQPSIYTQFGQPIQHVIYANNFNGAN